MQGGHEDHFRPGHAPDSPSRKEAQALIRPDVTQEVSLPKFNLVDDTQVDGTMFDRAVNLLRFYSSRNVSRVVALFCGFTDIEKFRKHKLEHQAVEIAGMAMATDGPSSFKNMVSENGVSIFPTLQS